MLIMINFIVENLDKERLGEVIYSKKKFKVNISSSTEKKYLERLLGKFSDKGIQSLRGIIFKKPVTPNHPLFLNEVRNKLAERGYILIEKKTI